MTHVKIMGRAQESNMGKAKNDNSEATVSLVDSYHHPVAAAGGAPSAAAVG